MSLERLLCTGDLARVLASHLYAEEAWIAGRASCCTIATLAGDGLRADLDSYITEIVERRFEELQRAADEAARSDSDDGLYDEDRY